MDKNDITFEDLHDIYGNSINSIETVYNLNNDKCLTNEPVIASVSTNENKTIWTFDTGASEHITNCKEILKDFHEEEITPAKTTFQFLGL